MEQVKKERGPLPLACLHADGIAAPAYPLSPFLPIFSPPLAKDTLPILSHSHSIFLIGTDSALQEKALKVN